MPSFVVDEAVQPVAANATPNSPHSSHEKSFTSPFYVNTTVHGIDSLNGDNCRVSEGLLQSIPNGRPSVSGSTYDWEKLSSREGRSPSLSNGAGPQENGRRSPATVNGTSRVGVDDTTHIHQTPNGTMQPLGSRWSEPPAMTNGDGVASSSKSNMSTPQSSHAPAAQNAPPSSIPLNSASVPQSRFSYPPNVPTPSSTPGAASTTSSTQYPASTQLRHRHTLQVPKVATSRTSRDLPASTSNFSDEAISSSGHYSPRELGARRASITLGRRTTRSISSDLHVDEIPQDEDAVRWTEAIRQKRASKRKKKEEEDDDRVVVGTKVDQNHVNWVTAYNMLTGIRFVVSRTNAKMDRPLTDLDFEARHKFSFDITGNELTPSAKYDFKFKDYAPWVFRHLRTRFRLDPADYLMSLTSKYILSELGSPGKSGSFFYFSRDYKYIIKTIHHSEHKFLRKILRDYYEHVENNPNTLLSQFYGLHRVKIPYGRKIHFVVMNNLFPPHRDIHQTFDLKGSMIGRDFKEEDLASNPRATLKDLNWLRRDLHLEFGPAKRQIFISQMEQDVRLLQRLKIMDYSLLIGIHDVQKGNEENLRDKTLQVFQPGGERNEEPQNNMLLRTPSKLENARKARELREIIKKEKPIPMDKSSNKMPDEILERKHFAFYGDDGGFRATHEDNRPGEEIYYLGIIDCLTHYGMLKKAETFWKGLSHPKAQISPIPPEAYGERFLQFITGNTKSKEEAEREKQSMPSEDGGVRHSTQLFPRWSSDNAAERAERQGVNEEDRPPRTLTTVRSPSAERTNGVAGATLPVVEEVGEAGSTSGRSRNGSFRREDTPTRAPPPPPPPDEPTRPPPPPPEKDDPARMKPLPSPPPQTQLSPQHIPGKPVQNGPEDLELRVTRISS
ncbi:MAG: Phosphatidylinositol-4-phosphate 5-kinase [Geoglossum umbratile]|nr:MAG: Phosphatidylinositol-4-phosphate 5-kinase [Geoglossum umbratile]